MITPISKIRAAVRAAFGIMPTLDLHGLGVPSARAEVAQFLAEARTRGWSSVRIIYGKGRGSPGGHAVLKNVVIRWLDEEGRPLIRRYERQLDSRGEDGAVIVWVRPNEPE